MYKLKSYNIDTTIMLPIGRQYVTNGVYSNNNTYNTRREKYIKIMEALQDRYGIELLRTDRLYSAIVPKTSGLQISPQESDVPKFLSSDNLHPTAWGYGKMAATIYNHYCNFNKGQQDNFH